MEHFINAIESSRIANQIKNLSIRNINWDKIITTLLSTNSIELDKRDETANSMIKNGLLCEIPKTNKYGFANPAIRLLLLKKTLSPLTVSGKLFFLYF